MYISMFKCTKLSPYTGGLNHLFWRIVFSIQWQQNFMVNISIITLYIVSFCKNSRWYHYYHAVIFFWIATALKSFVYFQSLVWKNMLLALNRRINDDSLRESYATKQYTVCHILWIVKSKYWVFNSCLFFIVSLTFNWLLNMVLLVYVSMHLCTWAGEKESENNIQSLSLSIKNHLCISK